MFKKTDFGLRLRNILLAIVLFTGMSSISMRAGTIIDNFNDGNDQGWSYWPGNNGASFGVQASGDYRIKISASAGAGLGFTTRLDAVYQDFYLSVDLVDWDKRPWPANLGTFGLFARGVGLQSSAPGDAYAFVIRPNQQGGAVGFVAVQIFRFQAAQTSLSSKQFQMDLTKKYRLTFSGQEDLLRGEIYALDDLSKPIVTLEAHDHVLTAGVAGLVAYDYASFASLGEKPADFTADNYFSAPSIPPQVTIVPAVQVSWPSIAGGYVLVGSGDLAGLWGPITNQIFQAGSQTAVSIPLSDHMMFFQLRAP